jgi:hypothetical protein
MEYGDRMLKLKEVEERKDSVKGGRGHHRLSRSFLFHASHPGGRHDSDQNARTSKAAKPQRPMGTVVSATFRAATNPSLD